MLLQLSFRAVPGHNLSALSSDHRSVLVGQQSERENMLPPDQHRRHAPQHRQQRIHRATATTFLASLPLGTVVGSTALHRAVRTKATAK